jgi:hypothetical protein
MMEMEVVSGAFYILYSDRPSIMGGGLLHPARPNAKLST